MNPMTGGLLLSRAADSGGGGLCRHVPGEVVADILQYLEADDLRQVELCCSEWRWMVAHRGMWRRQFGHKVLCEDWRVPETRAPLCWKRHYHQSMRHRALDVKARIPESTATIFWKVSLPKHAGTFRRRSTEFAFSSDALGEPMRWQIEVELEQGLPVEQIPHSPHHKATNPSHYDEGGNPLGVMLFPPPELAPVPSPSPSPVPSPSPTGSVPREDEDPAAAGHAEGAGSGAAKGRRGKKKVAAAPEKLLHRQLGLVRMWTTNNWTTAATQHYYGSHCTVSIRDSLSSYDVQEEVNVDIDSSAALEFDTAYLDPCRDLLIKVTLTLALELAVPLQPFYKLISLQNKEDSEVVKIGYCKAVFEVARCKRKSGGMFVNRDDRDVRALVELASDPTTSTALRIEVFQALFNLLGPTSVLLEDEVVMHILYACFGCLQGVPVPFDATTHNSLTEAAHDSLMAGLLAQNALGTVFNLLVHPLCHRACTPVNLYGVAKLLHDSTYKICQFSVITVLLTVLSWNKLPPQLLQPLEMATISFMTANNPLDSDCTGVAWDESDVAAFFIPLLRSRPLICVMFATWCIAKYYFPHTPALTLPAPPASEQPLVTAPQQSQ